MNVLDRAVEYVAPGLAARRVAARAQMKAIRTALSYYDGADLGRRGSSIRRSGAAPDTISARTLPALRNGSRDLVRNNPHAARAVQAIVSNVVGHGITPRFKRGRTTVRRLERLARQTLHRTVIDYDDQLDYFGIQALSLQSTVEGGDSLLVRHWVDEEFPMKVQVLEGDFLDTSRDTIALPNGGRIVQGVEYDARGRRVGFWLFEEHPGSIGRMGRVRSRFWPASEVTQIFRIDRPGQVRGIPWAAPVMLRLADFDDYEHAQLVRQKIAACYSVIYTDGIGAPPAKPQDVPEKVEPGTILRLGQPGSDIKFGSPPPVTDYKPYSDVSLHAIAAGFGVSYEALTGDLRGVNFASGRMGRLEFQRNIRRWQSQMLIPQACDVVIRWWLEAASLMNIDTRNVEVRHGTPPVEMVSPEREVPATTAKLRSGQSTLQRMAGELGTDVEQLLDEIQETNQMLDERGIVLDSDPRKVSAAGLTQARAGESLTFPPTGDEDEDEQGGGEQGE